MTNDSRRYTPDGEPIESFIATEQATLIRYLIGSYKQEKITQTYYNYALEQHCEATDWDGASEYFLSALNEFIEQSQHYEYYRLLERIETGEAWLAEIGPNDIRYTRGREKINELCKQLNKYQREGAKDQPHDGERNKSA